VACCCGGVLLQRYSALRVQGGGVQIKGSRRGGSLVVGGGRVPGMVVAFLCLGVDGRVGRVGGVGRAGGDGVIWRSVVCVAVACRSTEEWVEGTVLTGG